MLDVLTYTTVAILVYGLGRYHGGKHGRDRGFAEGIIAGDRLTTEALRDEWDKGFASREQVDNAIRNTRRK